MSIEPFKKPYYILPSLPPLIVMMALVAERFYLREPLPRRLGWLAFFGMLAALVGGRSAVRSTCIATILKCCPACSW